MNFFRRNTFFSIVFLCSFYIYPMKRTFTVLNLEQNAPQQCNSEKQKIYNMPVNEYFSWLNGHILHNSLTKKNRENILELAKKEKMSLEEATAIISGKKRSNQSHPQ